MALKPPFHQVVRIHQDYFFRMIPFDSKNEFRDTNRMEKMPSVEHSW